MYPYIKRLISPSQSQSFFLFGARGTGKSTFIQNQFRMKKPWFIDLLDFDQEDLYLKNPMALEQGLLQKIEDQERPDWIVIDEVQKAPRLLDCVHRLIERKKQKFILTGSSARKLKRGAANLLAGRAFVMNLFPLTSIELGQKFKLNDALHWGTLPTIHTLPSDQDKERYLKSYTQTFLKEEIQAEQLVRKLTPFRKFIEIAAFQNAQILNYEKIANDIGTDHKTVATYYQILEETFVGFLLPGFHLSIRKAQRVKPKFYFLDLGWVRALTGMLHSYLVERQPGYGFAFESWVINEIYRLNHYYEKDFKLSYLQTKDEAEIDLIISRGTENTAIEIKSSLKIDEQEVGKLERLAKDIPHCHQIYYISKDENPRKIGAVNCMHWGHFLEKFKDF